MGYYHSICKTACSKCDAKMLWTWHNPQRGPTPHHPHPDWTCRCGAGNVAVDLERWPHVPRSLYIGHDKHYQLKLYPLPADSTERWAEVERWAQPYSIRSFVYQASRELGACWFNSSVRGEVMGEKAFRDVCADPDSGGLGSWPCHMLAGWTRGVPTCPLWENISKLCQTETERKFLHWYLSLVKDRQFPMLIPQARIGIAERRRPDFVLFVPLQYWKYRWYAIQLDKAHGAETAKSDELRDAEISVHGYQVIRLKPEDKGYLEEVKLLVERIEHELTEVERYPWEVAVEIKARHTREEQDQEPPF